MEIFETTQQPEYHKAIITLGSQLHDSVRGIIAQKGPDGLKWELKPKMYPEIVKFPFDLHQAVGISMHWLNVIGFRLVGEEGLSTLKYSILNSKKLGVQRIMPNEYPHVGRIDDYYYRCLNYGNPDYRRGEIDIEYQIQVVLATLSCLTNHTLTDIGKRGLANEHVEMLTSRVSPEDKQARAIEIHRFLIPFVADINRDDLANISAIIRGNQSEI